MLLLQAILVGFLACSVCAIKIDVTINGRHEESIPTGSDVILNCSAPQGDAVDRFDWLKGNQSVPDHVVTTSFQGGVWWSSLVLQNVSSLNTTAVYTCRTWKNNSTKATLQRYICVDEIALQVNPMSLRKDAGGNKVITCTVQASCKVPSLQWLDQSSNIITDNDRVERTSRTVLKLKLFEVTRKDSGTYTCRAINSAGREVKTQDFYLIVKEKRLPQQPLMTSPHQEAVGYYGNDVTLSFSTQYTPRGLTHGVWRHDGRVLHDSHKYTLHESWSDPGTNQGRFSITVHNLTKDDSGNYTLRVTTAVVPPAVGHVQLKVYEGDPYKIRVIDVPDASPVKSKNIDVSCQIEYPTRDKQPPRLYWALNGTRLTSQSKYKILTLQEYKDHSTLITMVLTILNYSQSDCHWYTCCMNTSQGVKKKLLVTPCSMNKTTGQQDVDESKDAWFFILLTIPFSTAGVVIGCFLMKKYKKKTIYRMSKGLEINKEILNWDLFISYTSKDFEWVSKKLLPLLEKNKISYSIHSKDFEVGKTIVDNMAESVYSCKQVVAILSESYLKSKFCLAELDMAVCRHVAMVGSRLTVIAVDETPIKKLPKKSGKKVHVECVEKDDSQWEKRLMEHLIPLVMKANSSSKTSMI